VSAILSHNWWSVQVDLVVDNQKWVWISDHIVVNAYTVEVLLKQVLEEHVFLLQSTFLLFDSELIKLDLVKSLVEIVKSLVGFVGLVVETLNFLDSLVRIVQNIRIRLVKRKNFLFLSLKLSA
jgi:hypothetical protein